MDFLLFTLTLGSFLIILPSSSEEQLSGTVGVQIPQYSSIYSAVKINCSFQTNEALIKMVLENGNQEFTTYNIGTGTYIMQPTPGVTMESHLDSGMKSGHFTFAFSRLTCSDFTWYRCKAEISVGNLESANKTLGVAPIIDSVRLDSQSILSVNKLSIFTSMATIAKERSYTLKWFKGSISRNNEITGGQIKRDTSNECSRTITGELLYNVTLSDVPTLILWCQISVGQVVQKMGNFTIPEPITTPGPRDPEPVKNMTSVISNTVEIDIPPSAPLSSTLRINCIFKTTKSILKMVLENGNRELVAYYDFDAKKYVLVETDEVHLELHVHPTKKYGYFTFVFSRLNVNDFTWYRCKADDGIPIFSANKTLQDMTSVISNTVEIDIPPSALVSSTLKIHCLFKTTKSILKMVLENGNRELVAYYDFDAKKYVLVETDGVYLELNVHPTKKYGYFTFVFSRLNVNDFTWYRCKADDGIPIFSAKKTLQVENVKDNQDSLSSSLALLSLSLVMSLSV